MTVVRKKSHSCSDNANYTVKKKPLGIKFAECDFKNDLKIIWPHSVESLGQLYNQMLQEMPSYITFHFRAVGRS